MSEQDKNKIVNPALAKINALKTAAGKGDKTAIAELQNIRSAIHNAYVDKLAESMAAPIAAQLEAAQNEPDIIGADELFGLDPLDRAAHLKQRLGDIDGLSHKAALMHGTELVQREVANWVRTQPPSSSRAPLGNVVMTQPAPLTPAIASVSPNNFTSVAVSGTPTEVARWVGDDVETTNVTITAGFIKSLSQQLGNFVNGSRERPYAIILWGTRGFSLRAEVDVGRGFQFTVNGSSVVLQFAQMSSSLTQVAPGIELAGLLSYRECTHENELTRTIYIDAMPPFDPGTGFFSRTQEIIIPAFATSFSVLRSDARADLTININSTFDGDYSIHIPSNGTAAETNFQRYLLDGDSYTFNIFNNGPGLPVTATTSIKVIFYLGF